VTYGSTRLVTREKFNQAQGHWEGRIMVTPEAGVWPAWWALGTSKPWAAGGEIDFFEDSGTTGWHAAAHCPNTMGISGFGSGGLVTWRFALAWR